MGYYEPSKLQSHLTKHPIVKTCSAVGDRRHASWQSSSSPLALLPPDMAPAAAWMRPSVWWVWAGSSGAAAGAGTPLGSAGRMRKIAGGTAGIQGTGETGGTGMAAAETPRFAEPTGKRGREDRPPQTQAGTASWPACVLRGEEVEVIVGGARGRRGGKRKASAGWMMGAQERCRGHRSREGKGSRCSSDQQAGRPLSAALHGSVWSH